MEVAEVEIAPQIQCTTAQKRVVIEHTAGPMKGTFQVIGVLADGQEPPTFLGFQNVEPGRGEGASLIKVTPRAAYYRELWMNPTGRLGSFNPAQR